MPDAVPVASAFGIMRNFERLNPKPADLPSVSFQTPQVALIACPARDGKTSCKNFDNTFRAKHTHPPGKEVGERRFIHVVAVRVRKKKTGEA